MSNSFSSKGTSSKNEKAVMAPGSHVKANLVDVIVEDKGDMIWTFKNEVGNLQHKEFNIDPTHPSYKEEYADGTVAKIKHLACAFLGEAGEAAIDAIVAPNFKTWASQVASMVMNSPNKGVEVTLKVVVNKKNFVALPLFPNFISSAIRPLDWRINPAYDVFVFSDKKPDKAPDARNKEIPEEGSFEANTSTDDEDDTF